MDVSLESKSLPSVGYSRKSYLQTTSQKFARGKLVHLHGRRSLALPSVGSGGLQGEFGDLDIKYLKQNISKSRSKISGSFRRTPRHCILRERNSPGKRYQRIRTCLTGEVETSSFPIRHQVPDVKYPEKVECRPDRIPDGPLPLMTWSAHRYPEQLHPDFPRGHATRSPIRSNSIQIPQEDTRRAPLSGLPQGEAQGTREHHTPDDSTSYPDMLSGSLTKVSKPCYSPCSAALQWCVRMPCPDIFAMDSKELSSISNCFGDQRAIKIPKLNTILIRIDCKGL
uniref:Uncharacterized protein n=1 Tax=Vitis vinifera TaxID=29760 RepID=A5BY06_VITVI|nr:hypothetical protein VITISV_036373 [Vitis vinifera]